MRAGIEVAYQLNSSKDIELRCSFKEDGDLLHAHVQAFSYKSYSLCRVDPPLLGPRGSK